MSEKDTAFNQGYEDGLGSFCGAPYTPHSILWNEYHKGYEMAAQDIAKEQSWGIQGGNETYHA